MPAARNIPGDKPFWGILVLFLAANIALWAGTRHMRPVWGNVPPAMSERGAMLMAGGDRQLAYRVIGLMLQNLGSSGGTDAPLDDYNYNALEKWFFLADKLDPHADFIPYLAAYYYGASQNPKQLTPVIDYLTAIGQRPQKERWRFLAQAVYLARYRQHDFKKALHLAKILAALPVPDLPVWARSMPAFVMRANGDQHDAYTLLMHILTEGAKNKTLNQYDIRFLRNNICRQTLTPAQAAQNPLCTKPH